MTDPPNAALPAPRFVERGPFALVGIRERHAFADPFAQAIGAQWARLTTNPDALPAPADGAMWGASFGEPDRAGFAYLCGVELADAATLPDGFVVARIPARRWAVFPHAGPIDDLRHTIDAVFGAWLPESGFALAADDGAPDMLERYGPDFDPGTSRGDIEVWVPVGPA